MQSACKKGNVIMVMWDFNVQVDWGNQVGSGSEDKEFVEWLLGAACR